MNMTLGKSLISLTMALVTFQANSIVIRHDVEDSKYQASIKDFPPLATLYKIGVHGTLIDPSWVVTAGHGIFCVENGDTIKVENQFAEVETRYTHSGYLNGDENDIALIKLKTPITNIEPAKLYRSSDEATQNIWFIGSGAAGTGLTGQTDPAISGNKGLLRKAENKIEKTSQKELFFVFDKGDNALPLEGVSGNADSGGPAYKVIDGQYYVYGVSSRADSPTLNVGEYGVTEIYSRISYHASWIDKVVAGDRAFIKNYTTQYHFAQGNIKDNLPAVCNKIGFES
ncbi:serine protease [Pseudoalteromonas phenolica]|uniref:Serine protease n=2 Tax=Pseudoalteromonas phenolica TaxID=161398 RepID=A0A4Q7IGY4_9GAMM|nr:serine protease [Pseudoalteromonas phenolica]